MKSGVGVTLKRKAAVWAGLLMLFFALCLARAEISVSANIEPDEFVTVSSALLTLHIQNTGDTDIDGFTVLLPGDASLYAPKTVKAGETLDWVYNAYVSDEMLETGYFTVTVEYTENGENRVSQSVCRVARISDELGANLYVKLPDRAVCDGETIKISYILSNDGHMDIKNVYVTCYPENVTVGPYSVDAGEYITVERYVTADTRCEYYAKALCESAYSGRTGEIASEKARLTPRIASVELYAVTDESVFMGETAHITVSIENAGNVKYTSLVLEDASLGVLDGAPYFVDAGEFVTFGADTGALYADTTLKLTLTALGDDGKTLTCEADEINIRVTKPESANSESSANVFYDGENIVISLSAGAEEMNDVALTEKELGVLARFEVICPGENVTYVLAPQTNKRTYAVKLEYTDENGERQTLDCEKLKLKANIWKRLSVWDESTFIAFFSVHNLWLYIGAFCVFAALCILLRMLISHKKAAPKKHRQSRRKNKSKREKR